MPKRQRPHYIVVPTALIDDPRIPDNSPLFRRYCHLLIGAWIDTGSSYHHIDASNAQLAQWWQIAESSARASLAEMKHLGWVTVEQIGRVRRIHLHMAWRGKGKDSVAESNAPPTRALRPKARTIATRSLTSMGDSRSEPACNATWEGAGLPSAHARLPNAAVVKRKKQKKNNNVRALLRRKRAPKSARSSPLSGLTILSGASSRRCHT